VRVYTATVQTLLARDDLSMSVQSELINVLQQSEVLNDLDAKAWALRRVLDAAIEGLSAGRGPAPQRKGIPPKGDSSRRSDGSALIRDFVRNVGIDVQARVVNDTVMGGRSDSRTVLSGSGLVFQGNVTRQGGGGFASLRIEAADATALQNILGKGEGVAFTVRLMDGCKAWKFQLLEGYDQTSWQADFTASSSGGEQRIPFSRFVPSWRGRPQGRPGLTAGALQNIRSFGFMLSFLAQGGNNNPGFHEGPFSLSIEQVAIY